jgi:hypothetical protein
MDPAPLGHDRPGSRLWLSGIRASIRLLHRLRYLVAARKAMVLHGYPRPTGHTDESNTVTVAKLRQRNRGTCTDIVRRRITEVCRWASLLVMKSEVRLSRWGQGMPRYSNRNGVPLHRHQPRVREWVQLWWGHLATRLPAIVRTHFEGWRCMPARCSAGTRMAPRRSRTTHRTASTMEPAISPADARCAITSLRSTVARRKAGSSPRTTATH